MSFEWIECSFFLKKVVKNTEVTVNLTPYHKLQYLNQDLDLVSINFEVKITFQKPLMYDSAMGWNWHKSWNIPDISVELMTQDTQAFNALNNMKRLYTQVYIVKPTVSKEYSLCIEDLGLEGNTCLSLDNNRATFSRLKFSATSYNNEGSKFHFLLVVYQQSEHPDEPWKILLSKISTPVFVDSRKSAREAELIKLKKMSAFIEPFGVASIQKRFVKKESKKMQKYIQELIENNLEGLFKYFGAANIRNKVKHPLFLAFKFQECFEIYLNSKLIDTDCLQAQISWVQDCLEDMYKSFQAYKPPIKIQNKRMIMLIKPDPSTIRAGFCKKIPDFFQVLQIESMQVYMDVMQVPSFFKKLPIEQQTLEVYGRISEGLRTKHDIVYKNKELELKSIPTESRSQVGHPEKIKQALSQESMHIMDWCPERVEAVQKDQDQDQNQDEDQDMSQQSSPPDSFGDQRPNIPLKCQIIIDPLRKKALKLDHILQVHQLRSNKLSTIKCEKNKSASERELQILNRIMKAQIQQFRIELLRQQKPMLVQPPVTEPQAAQGLGDLPPKSVVKQQDTGYSECVAPSQRPLQTLITRNYTP